MRHLIALLQMLLQFEKELAQAVEALTKEQEKAAQAEREKQTQVVNGTFYVNMRKKTS